MTKLEIDYLLTHGAGRQAHSGSSLLAHFVATRDMLRSWDASSSVCLAGLFHSVYGTQSFDGLVGLAERENVRRVIGDEAEALAYLFCAMTPATLLPNLSRDGQPYLHDRFTGKWLFITRTELEALCNIAAANWLEQAPRIGFCDTDPALYASMVPLLLPGSRPQVEQALRGAT
jgi:hypothetical protein